MSAWNGGPCPDCGEEAPEAIIRCRNCGRLLNPALQLRPPKPLSSVELPEIRETLPAMVKAYQVGCPGCGERLRIAVKYDGRRVQCKFCRSPFTFSRSDPSIRLDAVFANCPHCRQEIRASAKYLQERVACKHCDGPLRIDLPQRAAP